MNTFDPERHIRPFGPPKPVPSCPGVIYRDGACGPLTDTFRGCVHSITMEPGSAYSAVIRGSALFLYVLDRPIMLTAAGRESLVAIGETAYIPQECPFAIRPADDEPGMTPALPIGSGPALLAWTVGPAEDDSD